MKTGTETKFFPIPDYWTPAQALAAYELLGDLMEIVWETHQQALIQLYQQHNLSEWKRDADIAEVDHP